MKFRVWMLLQRIKKFILKLYNSAFIQWIRGTLLFNFFQVFILVMCFLWIIFLFAPQSAHVSYQTKNVQAVGNINADKVDMDIKTNRYFINCFDETELYCQGNENIIVDDKIYDSSYKIKIEPYSKDYSTIVVSEEHLNNMELTLNSFISYDNNDNSSVFINYISSQISIQCKNGFQLVHSDNTNLSFFECDAFLVKKGVEPIPIYHCQIESKNSLSYILGLNSNGRIDITNYLNDFIHTEADITLYGIKNFSSKSSDDLIFSYSPSATTYTLNNQILQLNSKNHSLEADLSLNNGINELNINGMVNHATISGMNLFPSFFSWYRDNVYLAPLTLLTTVFGGVTIMINKKRKK